MSIFLKTVMDPTLLDKDTLRFNTVNTIILNFCKDKEINYCNKSIIDVTNKMNHKTLYSSDDGMILKCFQGYILIYYEHENDSGDEQLLDIDKEYDYNYDCYIFKYEKSMYENFKACFIKDECNTNYNISGEQSDITSEALGKDMLNMIIQSYRKETVFNLNAKITYEMSYTELRF